MKRTKSLGEMNQYELKHIYAIFDKWVIKQEDMPHKGMLRACALFQADNLNDACKRFKNYYINQKECISCKVKTAWNITLSSTMNNYCFHCYHGMPRELSKDYDD